MKKTIKVSIIWDPQNSLPCKVDYVEPEKVEARVAEILKAGGRVITVNGKRQ